MILQLIRRIAERPLVYDCIQKICGAEQVHAKVARYVPRTAPGQYVLDVGGGTGNFRKYWAADCHYICLDLEWPKLERFRKTHPGAAVVQADAMQLPIPPGTIDAIAFKFVAHHLTDEVLGSVLRECHRVLRSTGTLLFVDPIISPDRLIGRLLWSLDRGEHPRAAECLHTIVARQFEVLSAENFAVLHEYVVYVLRKA